MILLLLLLLVSGVVCFIIAMSTCFEKSQPVELHETVHDTIPNRAPSYLEIDLLVEVPFSSFAGTRPVYKAQSEPVQETKPLQPDWFPSQGNRLRIELSQEFSHPTFATKKNQLL
jgi:hypothetical protein